MKRISTFLSVFMILCCIQTNAQRYLSEIFTDVDVTSDVTYGVNASVLTYAVYGEAIPVDLKMDVYEPTGDVETNRPLIVYFHTGNFLPFPQNGGPSGTRTDLNVVEMCTRLAKMGYVVASCDYRLGWNPVATTQDERVYTLINAAYRGVQDCRTAIRYFRMTEAEMSNPYGIDPDRVCVWGQGTGGYIGFAAATINNYADIVIPKFSHDVEVSPGVFLTLPMVIESVNGDIYGTSYGINPTNNNDTLCYVNHPNYSSDFNVMVNMGGACGDSSWVDAGDVPMISFHVPSDPFAPYNIGTVVVPVVNLNVVEVSGSYNVQMLAHSNGLDLNASFEAADALGDVYTTMANSLNDGYYGLYPLVRPATMPADSAPWEWWNSDNANNANGLQTNPDMSMTKGMAYLDTIQGYSAPRIMCAMMLPGSPCETNPPVNDDCVDAIDINAAMNGAINTTVESGPYTNVDAGGDDIPAADVTGCWFDDLGGVGDGNDPEVDHTVWFTFEGDGQDYIIVADDCQGDEVFEGDTQMIVYAGTCGDLVPIACNDDIDTQNNIYWAGIIMTADDNVTYYVAVDGFNYTGFGSPDDPLTTGDFCLQIQQTDVSINENVAPVFAVYPNPAKDMFTVNGKEKMTSVVVTSMLGDVVFSMSDMNTNTYRVEADFAPGIYFVDVYTLNGKSTSKIVIE